MEINAIVAGLSASLASVFSKLALEDGTNSLRHFSNALTSQPLLLVLQLFCLLLVLVCNIVMWVYFARSLQKHSNTAQAKATITTCNFIFSGFLGWLLFREVLSLMWWAGFALIIIGFVLMH